MSDPLRPPGTTPRRAEPLQPDRPARGTEAQGDEADSSTGNSSSREHDAAAKQREQSETALDNVRHP